MTDGKRNKYSDISSITRKQTKKQANQPQKETEQGGWGGLNVLSRWSPKIAP